MITRLVAIVLAALHCATLSVAQSCSAPLTLRLGANEFLQSASISPVNTVFTGIAPGRNADILGRASPVDLIQDLAVSVVRGWLVIQVKVQANTNLNQTALIASLSYNGRQLPRSTTGVQDTRWKWIATHTPPTVNGTTVDSYLYDDSSWLPADQTMVPQNPPVANFEGRNYGDFVSANGNTNSSPVLAWTCLYRGNNNTWIAVRRDQNDQVECMSENATSCVSFVQKAACLSAVDAMPARFGKPASCSTLYNATTGAGDWCASVRTIVRPWNQTAQWARAFPGAAQITYRMAINLMNVTSEPDCSTATAAAMDVVQLRRAVTPTKFQGSLHSNWLGRESATNRLLTIRLNTDDLLQVFIGPYGMPGSWVSNHASELNLWVDPSADLLIAIRVWNSGGGNRWLSGSVQLDGVPIAMLDGTNGGLPWRAKGTDGPGPPRNDWMDFGLDDSDWVDLNGLAGCSLAPSWISSYTSLTQRCQANSYWLDSSCTNQNTPKFSNDYMFVRLKIPMRTKGANLLVHPCACPANSSCDGVTFQCESGFYPTGRAVCSPCPQGSIKLTRGNQACVTCPSDAVCYTAASLLCGKGTYQNGTACPVCPTGYYKIGAGNEECAVCPVGARCSASALLACKPGYQWDQVQCNPCPTGTYKADDGFHSCLACPDNANCTTVYDYVCTSGFVKQDGQCIPIFDSSRAVPTTTTTITTTAMASTVTPDIVEVVVAVDSPTSLVPSSTPTEQVTAPAGGDSSQRFFRDNFVAVVVAAALLVSTVLVVVLSIAVTRRAVYRRSMLKKLQLSSQNQLLSANVSTNALPMNLIMATG